MKKELIIGIIIGLIMGVFAGILFSGENFFNKENPTQGDWIEKICPNEEEFACNKELQCEENIITLEGYVDKGNIDEDYPKFFLMDKEEGSVILEVGEAQSISIVLTEKDLDFFNDLRQISSNEVIKVTGIVKGFDMPTNFYCKRGFYILANPSDIKL